jgi:predicted lipid-binding transport protein (Tim44 family)
MAMPPPPHRAPFGVPDDFDTPGFLASAKRSFVRLQSAWDRADLKELAECATDDMFNALTHELRVRAGPSRTDIVALEANLLGIEAAGSDYCASVRFCGILRINEEDERLDEVWNLSRPADGSGGWLLSGIQQLN